MERYATSWLMLPADDCHLEVGDAHFRPALLVLFLLCSVVGCPLSWTKSSGGTTTSWVAFEPLLKEHAHGRSEPGAFWFVQWADGWLARVTST